MSATAPRLTSRQLYLRLLSYVRPHWRRFALSVLAMTLSALTEPFFAWLMKPLTQNFVTPDPHGILWVPLAVVGVFVLRGLATIGNEYTISWISGDLVQTLRRQMFDRLLRLPLDYFNHTPSGALISKLTYDVTQVSLAGVNILTVSVKDAITIAGLLGLLVYTDWLLTLICLTVIPLVGITIRAISKRLRQLSHNAQATMGALTAVIGEAIEGHRVVKVFGGEPYETQRFADLAQQVRRIEVKQSLASSANSNIVQFLIALALAAIIYVASVRSVHGGLTAGDFMSFMTAMLMLFAPFKRITSVSGQVQRGLAAAESVFGLIDQAPEADHGQPLPGRAAGELRLENLQFQYAGSERPALDGIDLTVPAGKTFALVGASGSGKTTLANLIPRFYRASGGRILLDGRDLNDIRLADLRRQIALVSQDVVLFNDSVAANIAYGRRDASAAEIEAAARAAHAWDFIQAMPQGLATVVGENGVRLSGGQRQRLAIARAILKDAPILILDEATSALDTESERHVQAALDNLMQGRSTLVIAHRLSTVENADCIVVLQNGRIVESGRHGELLAAAGAYADLYRMQFSEAGAV